MPSITRTLNMSAEGHAQRPTTEEGFARQQTETQSPTEMALLDSQTI
jgi:hypothetical protein